MTQNDLKQPQTSQNKPWSKMKSKLTQSWPKTIHNEPNQTKVSQKDSKWHPNWPKTAQNRPKSDKLFKNKPKQTKTNQNDPKWDLD